MKSNSTFMQNAPAQQLTRANQAWAIDFKMLDFAHRPFVMLVVDVGTRRALSATVSLAVAEDIVAALERLVRRSGSPGQVWIDNGLEYRLNTTHRAWAEQHGTSITYCPMALPSLKALTEPALRDLGAFLRDKRFATMMELGHDIERWRQTYTPAARTIPNVNQ